MKINPVISLPLRSIAILAVLTFLFSSCCTKAQPRFWKVRDTKSNGTAYTVDTLAVPTSSLGQRDIRYVDSSGKYVNVGSSKVISRMSEQEWKRATSGAGYSLWYCGHCHGCWAKTRER